MIKKLVVPVLFYIIVSCQGTAPKKVKNDDAVMLIERSKSIELKAEKIREETRQQNILKREAKQRLDFLDQVGDDEFVNIQKLSISFILDIRYATKDNFLGEKVYDCAQCYVRGAVAKSLIAANKEFAKKGYRIKLFDCYRPHNVQKKMWKIKPNPGYVANPKGGSVHNRGAAIDISLVDLQGNDIDMGTDFDYFGRKANHSYTNLSEKIKSNRRYLRSTMKLHGFSSINTEWWHYNFEGGKKYKISDFKWECDYPVK